MQIGVRKLGAQMERPRALRTAMPPRLRDNLDSLFTMIDNADAAPTSAQMKYFSELKAEYESAISAAK